MRGKLTGRRAGRQAWHGLLAVTALAGLSLLPGCSQPHAGEDLASLEEQSAKIRKELTDLAKTESRLAQDLAKFRPKGTYVVVDTFRNRISLYKDGALVVQDHCSTGTNSTLVDSLSGRSWTFRTPRGQRQIRGAAVSDPVWVRPDWAFIEEGEPIPDKYDERLEEGVLGEYALPIGDGYFIHGTLYTRLLGYPATHGCIRVGDETLKVIVKNVRQGTPVYIF